MNIIVNETNLIEKNNTKSIEKSKQHSTRSHRIKNANLQLKMIISFNRNGFSNKKTFYYMYAKLFWNCLFIIGVWILQTKCIEHKTQNFFYCWIRAYVFDCVLLFQLKNIMPLLSLCYCQIKFKYKCTRIYDYLCQTMWMVVVVQRRYECLWWVSTEWNIQTIGNMNHQGREISFS